MYNLTFEGPTLNIGPYTVLIVPEGSVAVTQENGKKELLDGGKSYILTHTLWSFEYLIDMSIQSDTYQGLGLMSADNIKLSVITNYVWKVVDSKVAARVISSSSLSSKVEVEETDNLVDADKSTLQQFEKIRYHTLNQVKGAVASFIGRLQYAQRFIQHAKNADKSDHKNEYNDMDDDNTYSLPHQTSSSFNNHLFDYLSWDKEMNETNKITKTFGVELVSIKIIKYIPVDERVQQSLTNAVLLSSETLQQEEKTLLSARTMKIEAEADALANKIHAESEANAILIRAKAEAEAEILKSDGDKVAEITRAEGMKEAALLLESSKVAITLEAMKISATALRNSDKFYFCQEPEFMTNLLMRGQEHGSSHLFSNDS
jgi:regulator of protease activity HflC (stomatin/prohibitin superfamily)